MSISENNWLSHYQEVIDFNKSLILGNYKRVSNLSEQGYTWVGDKTHFDDSGFVLPKDSQEFSKMIKVILDLGLMDYNEQIEEPFALFFQHKDVDSLKLWRKTTGIIKTIFTTFHLISKFDKFTQLKISKRGIYCVEISVQGLIENSPVFELEEKIFLELLSLLSSIPWCTC